MNHPVPGSTCGARVLGLSHPEASQGDAHPLDNDRGRRLPHITGTPRLIHHTPQTRPLREALSVGAEPDGLRPMTTHAFISSRPQSPFVDARLGAQRRPVGCVITIGQGPPRQAGRRAPGDNAGPGRSRPGRAVRRVRLLYGSARRVARGRPRGTQAARSPAGLPTGGGGQDRAPVGHARLPGPLRPRRTTSAAPTSSRVLTLRPQLSWTIRGRQRPQRRTPRAAGARCPPSRRTRRTCGRRRRDRELDRSRGLPAPSPAPRGS